MLNSSPRADGISGPLNDREHALHQAIEHQQQLLVRWLKAAHGLNNLFLVLRSNSDGPFEQALNEMIDTSVAELRGVVNDSRANVTETLVGRNFES